jgi:hypothetical protein
MRRRWFEYSISATLMQVSIAVVVSVRDRNTLLCVAALSFHVMLAGMLTELHSRPHTNPDGTVDYGRWQGQKVYAADPKDWLEGMQRAALKWKNYLWRMIPHFLAYFPYAISWAVLLQSFADNLDDLCERARDRVPDFVLPMVFGSAAIFSLFTLVQLR